MRIKSTIHLKILLSILTIATLILAILLLPAVINKERTGEYQQILIYLYITLLPFLITIYHSFKLLLLIDRKSVISSQAVQSIRYIKYSMLTIAVIHILNLPYIYLVADKDDAPGVVLIALIFTTISISTTLASAYLESKIIRKSKSTKRK